MRLSEDEINNYLGPIFGQYEDSFQEAWLKIIERDPQTMEDVIPIIRKIRNTTFKQYLHKKYREQSLYDPIGRSGDERFTLESILASPTNDSDDEKGDWRDTLYNKIVDFLIALCLREKAENAAFKRQEMGFKAQRLRLHEEELKFKRDRFESWKKLMEDKGKEKEIRLRLRIQLQREKFEFERSKHGLMADKIKKPFSTQMMADKKSK